MRSSSRAVCLPPGNWGSSHPCGNIAKCGENNIQQKNWKSKKNKKGKPPGRETLGAVMRRSRHMWVILPCDVRNITAWCAKYYRMMCKILPRDVQNITVWCAKYYSVMCKILLCDVQNITTWVQGLLTWYFPDPRMHESVRFVVGVRVVLGMVVSPVLGSGIPIVAESILWATAM